MASVVFPAAAVPALIAFDLDYTLWSFWCDTHKPPFKKLSTGKVVDRRNDEMKLHKDVVPILQQTKAQGIKIAAASRTVTPPEAKTLLKLYDIDKYFDYKEIYPGQKTTHFRRFQDMSKVPYEDMLFFDDEGRNIHDIGKIGVTCIHVDEDIGMTKAVFEEGLQKFAETRSKTKRGL